MRASHKKPLKGMSVKPEASTIRAGIAATNTLGTIEMAAPVRGRTPFSPRRANMYENAKPVAAITASTTANMYPSAGTADGIARATLPIC